MPRSPKTVCERTEPVMVWALRSNERRQAVHIADLKPHENGASCGCVCYSCGDKLRAINLDKPKSHFELKGSQQRHFKHDHGAADRKCLSAVAKLVALTHFVEQDEVLLPPQPRAEARRLANGHVINALGEAPGRTAKVLERTWIDDQSAVLLLDDGTELAVTVRTTHTLCEDGKSRAVLSLAGLQHSEAAGWSKEEILAHLRLPGWMKWERHWSDDQLTAEAGQELDDEESQLLGDIPREWLEGLSGKMASETILHWVIKRTFERTKMLKVPEVVILRSRTMPDGTVATEQARRGPQALIIDKVTFERKIGDMVPDVVCWASKMGGDGAPFQLLIEAAVTNYVDAVKRKKILDAGIACIQIRADMFPRAGFVPVSKIERQVSDDAAIKEWVCAPDMSHEIRLADVRLERKAREIQDRMDEEQRVREQMDKDQGTLNDWYREATDKALAKGYLKALVAGWRGDGAPKVGIAAVNVETLWQTLASRKLVRGSRGYAESKDGLLFLLWRIQSLPARTRHTNHAIELARSASQLGFAARAPLAALAVYALKAYHGSELRHTSDLYRETEDQINESLQVGEEMYVRLIDLDPLLHLLFPEMSDYLISSSATPQIVHEVRAKRIAAEAKATEVAQLRASRRRLVDEGRARKAAAVARDDVNAEITRLVSRTRWDRAQMSVNDAAKLNDQFGASANITSLKSSRIIWLALEFKADGRSIKALLEMLDLNSSSDVRKVMRLLRLCGVCLIDEGLVGD
jgi:hypothetical protein